MSGLLVRRLLRPLDRRLAARTLPLVRASALRRLADPAAKGTLLKALESDDPFLQQAAREGLKRSLKFPELIEPRERSRAGSSAGGPADPEGIGPARGPRAGRQGSSTIPIRRSGSPRSSGSARSIWRSTGRDS